LYTITQEQLAYSLFPLGKIAKPKVRELAQNLKLNVANKKDSVGICFIGEKDFQKFLTTYIKPNPGNIVDDKGKIIGKHTGLMYYTIGQRQGLGIGGVKDTPPLPWFVVAKNHQENELIAIQGGDHPLLQSTTLISDQLNWISGEEPKFPFTCKAKTRYRQTDQDCTVYFDSKDHVRVEFSHQQRAVTPGQSVVFYQDNVCLGGGIIQHTNTLTNQCELRENNEK
jgi:tRNA-specific 2-thiouridylase